MPWELTAAEKKAIEAQALSSFPINVEEIRRTVAELLSEFGRHGFFDEYTVHSFDHVHEMLKCLDWLIPGDTQAILTKGEWLLITLAVTFMTSGSLSHARNSSTGVNPLLRTFVRPFYFLGTTAQIIGLRWMNSDRTLGSGSFIENLFGTITPHAFANG